MKIHVVTRSSTILNGPAIAVAALTDHVMAFAISKTVPGGQVQEMEVDSFSPQLVETIKAAGLNIPQ